MQTMLSFTKYHLEERKPKSDFVLKIFDAFCFVGSFETLIVSYLF